MTDADKLDFLMTEVATLRTDISYIKNSICTFSTFETRISILEKSGALLQKLVYGTVGLVLTAVGGGILKVVGIF
jgi:hypothetical protein